MQEAAVILTWQIGNSSFRLGTLQVVIGPFGVDLEREKREILEYLWKFLPVDCSTSRVEICQKLNCFVLDMHGMGQDGHENRRIRSEKRKIFKLKFTSGKFDTSSFDPCPDTQRPNIVNTLNFNPLFSRTEWRTRKLFHSSMNFSSLLLFFILSLLIFPLFSFLCSLLPPFTLSLRPLKNFNLDFLGSPLFLWIIFLVLLLMSENSQQQSLGGEQRNWNSKITHKSEVDKFLVEKENSSSVHL